MTLDMAVKPVQENETESSARSSSFYTAMRIMPLRERQAMYEIYDFCRAIDDIADEAGETEDKLLRLKRWREDIDNLYQNNPPARLGALANAVAAFGLRKQDFHDVIDGMEMDVLGPIQAPDYATLELYCDRVACAVGRLSVRVFGLGEQEGLKLSYHLGMALQLTNILRDVDEDAGIDRLYLPHELLTEAGITSHNPHEVLAHPAIAGICEILAGKALAHFNAANALMKSCERKQVRTPRIMSQAYQTIHTALMERGFASPRQPVRLNKAKLGYILVRNILF